MEDLTTPRELHNRYVRGSSPEALVPDETILLAYLTNTVFDTKLFLSHKVYLNTKTLKHMYDKKPAEEYDKLIDNLATFVRFPERIYENKSGKRGDLGFVKTLEDELYFCSIEREGYEKSTTEDESRRNYLVTAFRVRKDRYLNDYKLLWSWKGDGPSS